MNGIALVVGASGKFAGLVVPEPASRDVMVCALVHDPHDREDVTARGANRMVVGDLADPEVVQHASGRRTGARPRVVRWSWR